MTRPTLTQAAWVALVVAALLVAAFVGALAGRALAPDMPTTPIHQQEMNP